ncbi:MAG: hybrid sensor histidine kinase/response regulator, partial [Pseudanabaena sp. RU_4_16]|nr:hybrid sensor histidine kinase/response regulator [Pseudanabaena sp. RU_4_16]
MGITRILIVEDESIIAMTLSHILEDLGYTVIDAVSSGEAAIQAVNQGGIDLVLMDINIDGDIDGIETVIRIRQQHNIPIVYLTSYADDETIARAEKTGSFGYILKPFKGREVRAAIQIALSKYREELLIRQTLKNMEARNFEQSQYIAIAAHEFRTPLTSIGLAADILQNFGDRLPHDKKQRRFEGIQSAVRVMNQLIDEALTLGQLDSGKLQYSPRPTNIRALCHDLMEEFQLYAGDRYTLTYTYSQTIDPQLSPNHNIQIAVDESLLRPILNNLLANAIKYSPAGGEIVLEIACEPCQVRLCLRDPGIGIPLEFQPKLFQRFVRANNVGQI